MAIDGVTSCMKIREVNKNKKQFISLLLLADERNCAKWNYGYDTPNDMEA